MLVTPQERIKEYEGRFSDKELKIILGRMYEGYTESQIQDGLKNGTLLQPDDEYFQWRNNMIHCCEELGYSDEEMMFAKDLTLSNEYAETATEAVTSWKIPSSVVKEYVYAMNGNAHKYNPAQLSNLFICMSHVNEGYALSEEQMNRLESFNLKAECIGIMGQALRDEMSDEQIKALMSVHLNDERMRTVYTCMSAGFEPQKALETARHFSFGQAQMIIQDIRDGLDDEKRGIIERKDHSPEVMSLLHDIALDYPREILKTCSEQVFSDVFSNKEINEDRLKFYCNCYDEGISPRGVSAIAGFESDKDQVRMEEFLANEYPIKDAVRFVSSNFSDISVSAYEDLKRTKSKEEMDDFNNTVPLEKFDPEQQLELIAGFSNGVPLEYVNKIADPSISAKEMCDLRNELQEELGIFESTVEKSIVQHTKISESYYKNDKKDPPMGGGGGPDDR